VLRTVTKTVLEGYSGFMGFFFQWLFLSMGFPLVAGIF
jgi:hypothetical protein